MGIQAAADVSWGQGIGAAGAPITAGNDWEGSLYWWLEEQETQPSSLHPPFHPSSQAQVEGLTCSQCRPHHFHLSTSNPDGCLPCFCMGITQQCASSSYARHLVRACMRPSTRPATSLSLGHHWGKSEAWPSGGPTAYEDTYSHAPIIVHVSTDPSTPRPYPITLP